MFSYCMKLVLYSFPSFFHMMFSFAFFSGIECLIADADVSMIKLIDAINKRGNNPKTSHLPIVSTVLLVPSDVDNDFFEKLRDVGGANVTLAHPGALTEQIFSRILETMYQMSSIEKTYKELSKSTQMVTFPYLPLFHSSIDVDNDGEADYGLAVGGGDEDDDDDDDDDDNDDENDDENQEDHHFEKIEAGSVNSWTYASSMLPEFVKDGRNKAFTERMAGIYVCHSLCIRYQSLSSP